MRRRHHLRGRAVRRWEHRRLRRLLVTCSVEVGALCGDGTVDAACGEECDPPGASCDAECKRVPVCGDGLQDAGEECDDGNAVDCDGCSSTCRVETGCGDGSTCGAEECDDGNSADCDGCSSSCTVEVGARCGDGIVNAACGEECDPPGESCSFLCQQGNPELGTRHFTFGGSFFSSALGSQVPLGDLTGSIDLVAGAPDPEGVAAISVDGPVYYSAAILGGTYGYLCVRVDGCTGFVDCNGGTAVDTLMVQDSNGAGKNALPATLTTGRGEDGGPGAVQLDCQQSFVQLPPGGGNDCLAVDYPESQEIVYTTGGVEAFFLNANTKVGNGSISGHGEAFDCATWTSQDGPGQLIGTYTVEEDPQAGDVANENLLDD